MTARRYLVVDDNAELADNLAEILNDHGAEAVAVESAARALELLATQHFDALVTDLRMPGLNGAELIRRARQLDPGLPVLVVSAFERDQEMAAAEEQGLLGVLPKPLPIPQLIELLDAAKPDATVLVVEDDPSLRSILSEALASRGLSVVAVADHAGLEAVLGKIHPFVVLVDLKLPGGDMGDAFRSVTGQLKGTPTLVMTAFADEWPGQESEVLRKPFDTRALLDRLDQLYQRSHRS